MTATWQGEQAVVVSGHRLLGFGARGPWSFPPPGSTDHLAVGTAEGCFGTTEAERYRSVGMGKIASPARSHEFPGS